MLMSTVTYTRRKSQGLCVRCGKTPEKTGVYCEECKGKQRKTRKEYEDFVKTLKICPRCRKNSVEVGINCPECLEKEAKYRQKNKDKINNYMKDYYLKTKPILKEKGLCMQCRKRKVKAGHTMCERCLAKKREYNKMYGTNDISRYERPSYGLCYVCGDNLDTENRICSKCKSKLTANLPKVPSGWKDNNCLFAK